MAAANNSRLDFTLIPPNHFLYNIESKVSKIGRHVFEPLPCGMRILFINGMFNGGLDVSESAIDISKSLQNKNVEHCVNDLNDIESSIRNLANKILDIAATCRTELMTQTTRRIQDICIVIIAHSHGTVILEKALEDPRIDASLKSKIRIITLGAAAILPSFGYKSVENLINEYDFIPLLAHTRELKNVSGINPTLLEAFFAIKNTCQENVLKMRSHLNPHLATRILSAMLCSWEAASSQETPAQKAVNALFKNLALKQPLNSTINEKNLVDMLLTGCIHLFYNISVLRIDRPSSGSYFKDFHSVQSYIPQLAPLVLNFIQDHSVELH